MKKILVLIPCYNEAKGIGQVIDNFPTEDLKRRGFELEVLVIDNNSTDDTSKVARRHGATVIHESKKGKGNAIRTGFYNIPEDVDFIVMLDGDATYRSDEIVRMIEPLDSGFSTVVTGSRLGGKIGDGSMKTLNRAGNWIYSHLVRYSYRVSVTDVLTGYFAWSRSAVVKLRDHLESSGFAIEMEMITKMARLGEDICAVPISYDARSGESNLRPFYDGSRILLMFARNLFWKPTIDRIAFVSDAIYPYNKGGKEKRLYEITKRLVKDGREVHIYTMKWWTGPKQIKKNGIYLHAISKLYPLQSGDKRSLKQGLLFGLATLKLLFVKFDVIDVDHMPFFPLFSAKLVCLLRGKPMYATWHEVWGRQYWQTYLGTAGIVAALIEKIAFYLPNTIISVSQHTTKKLIEAGVTTPIQTVPLGVDLEGIYTVEPQVNGWDVVYAGRLLRHKNVDLLIKSIDQVRKSYPDISCAIIGEGPEKSNLEELTKELHLKNNVQFLDYFEDHNDLYGLLKASKMLVLPSTREGFGLIVIEANACGIPAITLNHPGNAARELIVEGQNGMLADVSAESIAEKIILTLQDQGAMKPRTTLEQFFANHDWNMVTQAIEKAWAR
jgi:glycosyltransferase involved in cell wall biosynthesis